MPIAGVIRICYGTLLLINMLCLAPYVELWFTEAGPIPLAAARAILDPDAWIPFAWLPNSDSALTVWLSFTVMLVQSGSDCRVLRPFSGGEHFFLADGLSPPQCLGV